MTDLFEDYVSSEMARFVLIDHSICDLAGHHYQYAVHVLRAAERAGFEPILVTNRKFRQIEAATWATLPAYEFGFWTESGVLRRLEWGKQLLAQTRRLLFSARLRVRYSIFGLSWAGRDNWVPLFGHPPAKLRECGPYLFRASIAAGMIVTRAFLLLALAPAALVALTAAACWRLAWSAAGVAARFAYGSGSLGRLAVVHLNALFTVGKRCREFAQAVAQIVRSRWKPPAGQTATTQRRRQAAAFARDTCAVLRRLKPGPEDVFFIPTISPDDMLGLAKAIRDGPVPSSWHLLFRRNIFAGRPDGYAAQEHVMAELRDVFLKVRDTAGPARLHFYTDTDELTAQYDRIGVVKFETLPIPHTYSPQTHETRLGPVRVTYLGDARAEKGFHLLPRLAGDLEQEYLDPGRAHFVVQCNYNVPGGEPKAVAARGQLECLPAHAITLHKQPLTSAQYEELLLSAGVLLLLYDRDNYYARSSGIAVEALVAGVPILAPAGSWLSRQFLKSYYAHIEGLPERFRLAPRRAQTAVRWRKPAPAGAEGFSGTRFCHLQCPAGATHLLVRGQAREARDDRWRVSQLDDHSAVLLERTAIAEAYGSDMRAAWLSRLLPDTRTVQFSVRSGLRYQSIEFEFLRIPPHEPTGSAGQIYHDEEDIAELLRELIDHHDHYSRTAQQCGGELARYHNPDHLIYCLLGNGGQTAYRAAAEVAG